LGPRNYMSSYIGSKDAILIENEGTRMIASSTELTNEARQYRVSWSSPSLCKCWERSMVQWVRTELRADHAKQVHGYTSIDAGHRACYDGLHNPRLIDNLWHVVDGVRNALRASITRDAMPFPVHSSSWRAVVPGHLRPGTTTGIGLESPKA
jgi:hypothetical protein